MLKINYINKVQQQQSANTGKQITYIYKYEGVWAGFWHR